MKTKELREEHMKIEYGEKKYFRFVNHVLMGKKIPIMTPHTFTLKELAKVRYGSKEFLTIALIELSENFK